MFEAKRAREHGLPLHKGAIPYSSRLRPRGHQAAQHDSHWMHHRWVSSLLLDHHSTSSRRRSWGDRALRICLPAHRRRGNRNQRRSPLRSPPPTPPRQRSPMIQLLPLLLLILPLLLQILRRLQRTHSNPLPAPCALMTKPCHSFSTPMTLSSRLISRLVQIQTPHHRDPPQQLSQGIQRRSPPLHSWEQ